MKNLTYIEAIEHIRTYKEFFKLEAIAKAIKINPDQFRQIISKRQYAKNLPDKYRTDFIKVVTMLTSVQQIETEEDAELRKAFAPRDIKGNLFFDEPI